jgi:hypothetical protein
MVGMRIGIQRSQYENEGPVSECLAREEVNIFKVRQNRAPSAAPVSISVKFVRKSTRTDRLF